MMSESCLNDDIHVRGLGIESYWELFSYTQPIRCFGQADGIFQETLHWPFAELFVG